MLYACSQRLWADVREYSVQVFSAYIPHLLLFWMHDTCRGVYRGGTEVTVTGENIDASADPIITVTVVIIRHSWTLGDDDGVNAQKRYVRDTESQTEQQSTVTSEVSCFAIMLFSSTQLQFLEELIPDRCSPCCSSCCSSLLGDSL